MKASVYNQQAQKTDKSVELVDSVFAGEVNNQLLAQYSYVYLSNQRESIANVKDRSEVSGGGRKPWRQKGTGRARHGSSRSPIWSGGGVTFGPTSDRNWKKVMSKKMRQAAIRSAFTHLVNQDALKVVDQVEFKNDKLAKQAIEMWKSYDSPRKLTLIMAGKNEQVINACANLPEIEVVMVSELNAYDLLNAGTVLIHEAALEYINQNWQN